MRKFERIVLGAAMAGILASGTALADTPPVIDCPWYSPTGGDDFSTRAFYVPSYPGSTLKTVVLMLSATAPGTYSLSLTARQNGGFSGTLIGTATTTQTFGGTAPIPVTFDFGTKSVSGTGAVTFQGTVSGPGFVNMEVTTSASCTVIETVATDGALSHYRHSGVAVRITGDLLATFPHSVTFPAVASIHGAISAYFHTDVWLYNPDSSAMTVTATYYCYAGMNCGSGAKTFTVAPRAGLTFTDVVGSLFGAPETAGAIMLRYSTIASSGTLKALSRTYSPSLPAPTNGASQPGLLLTAATGLATFVGLGNNGGDRSAGFRTNAGVFNSYAAPATVTFQLSRTDGTVLGSTTQTWAALEARQVNDIFATVGAGSVVTTDAVLTVTSDIPVFSYVTVIDNQTQDSVIQ